MLRAGTDEPRILEVLPGIILHRPTILYRLAKDLPKCPEITALLAALSTVPAGNHWRGLSMRDLRAAAARIAAARLRKKNTQQTRNINIRLAESDLLHLRTVAAKRKIGVSEFLRELIQNAT